MGSENTDDDVRRSKSRAYVTVHVTLARAAPGTSPRRFSFFADFTIDGFAPENHFFHLIPRLSPPDSRCASVCSDGWCDIMAMLITMAMIIGSEPKKNPFASFQSLRALIDFWPDLAEFLQASGWKVGILRVSPAALAKRYWISRGKHRYFVKLIGVVIPKADGTARRLAVAGHSLRQDCSPVALAAPPHSLWWRHLASPSRSQRPCKCSHAHTLPARRRRLAR